MIKKEKRGVSPVVATVLLVALALILAIIVFLWARSFIEENILKNGEVIENSCANVLFDADLISGELSVVNQGNIPLYGVAVRKVGAGTEETCYPLESATNPTISSGESKGGVNLGDCSLGEGDNIKVIPVILGETENGERKYFTCEEQFGKDKTYSTFGV